MKTKLAVLAIFAFVLAVSPALAGETTAPTPGITLCTRSSAPQAFVSFLGIVPDHGLFPTKEAAASERRALAEIAKKRGYASVATTLVARTIGPLPAEYGGDGTILTGYEVCVSFAETKPKPRRRFAAKRT